MMATKYERRAPATNAVPKAPTKGTGPITESPVTVCENHLQRLSVINQAFNQINGRLRDKVDALVGSLPESDRPAANMHPDDGGDISAKFGLWCAELEERLNEFAQLVSRFDPFV